MNSFKVEEDNQDSLTTVVEGIDDNNLDPDQPKMESGFSDAGKAAKQSHTTSPSEWQPP